MDTRDLDPEDLAFGPIWTLCQPYTMTSFERGLALFRAIRYLHQNFIVGDFVECGVWRGGSSMIAMKTLQHFGISDRRFWLFDTFEGMTEASPLDVDIYGQSAAKWMAEKADERATDLVWALSPLDEVKQNIAITGYDASLITYVEGDIRHTAHQAGIGSIALLRLDTDFYDSTKIELEVLFPRLVEEGVLIVDDFGHWQGARKAVDEYFDEYLRSGQSRPYLERIDYTGRLAIKPTRRKMSGSMARYDWLAPGLKRANLCQKFPEMVERDPALIQWPYLRSYVPHIWRTDTRSHRLPDTGAISVEEAELLYNNALAFSGQRGLEIGCHFGWSTAHLVLAGLDLDVVDPALGHADQYASVVESLSRVQDAAQARLWPGFSPGILPAVHAAGESDYQFVFIDGYHEGEAPRLDAEMVESFCASTACVMFHDLTSPFVAAGLDALAQAGWNTGFYNTMQLVGIAWRGAFCPVTHIYDPNVPAPLQGHLAKHRMLSVAAAE
jgi:predicted O-methyltransferase YrrM